MTSIGVLLIPVHEVEPLIDPFRRRLDPTWRQDMPAHVTILVPFSAPEATDAAAITRLTAICRAFEPFDFVLQRTRWFDDRVLYLPPEPADPFRQMTRAVVEQFPRFPPYEGAFADIVPHVTVGEGGRWRTRRRQMRRAEARLSSMAPVRALASEVWLMGFDPATHRWTKAQTFSLGASGAIDGTALGASAATGDAAGSSGAGRRGGGGR